MMRRNAAPVALISLAAVLGGYGDAVTKVRGVVVTPDRVPVPEATVSVTRDSPDATAHTVTDADGCFDVGGTASPRARKHRVLVSKEGYSTESLRVRTNRVNERVIILETSSDGDATRWAIATEHDRENHARCFESRREP